MICRTFFFVIGIVNLAKKHGINTRYVFRIRALPINQNITSVTFNSSFNSSP